MDDTLIQIPGMNSAFKPLQLHITYHYGVLHLLHLLRKHKGNDVDTAGKRSRLLWMSEGR